MVLYEPMVWEGLEQTGLVSRWFPSSPTTIDDVVSSLRSLRDNGLFNVTLQPDSGKDVPQTLFGRVGQLIGGFRSDSTVRVTLPPILQEWQHTYIPAAPPPPPLLLPTFTKGVWEGFAGCVVKPKHAEGVGDMLHSELSHLHDKAYEFACKTYLLVFPKAIPTLWERLMEKARNVVEGFCHVTRDVMRVPTSVIRGIFAIGRRCSPYALGLLGCYAGYKLLAFGLRHVTRHHMSNVWRHLARVDHQMIDNQTTALPPVREPEGSTIVSMRYVPDCESWFTAFVDFCHRRRFPRLVLNRWDVVVNHMYTPYPRLQTPKSWMDVIRGTRYLRHGTALVQPELQAGRQDPYRRDAMGRIVVEDGMHRLRVPQVTFTVTTDCVSARQLMFAAVVGKPVHLLGNLLTLPYRAVYRDDRGLPQLNWDWNLLNLMEKLGVPGFLIDKWRLRLNEKHYRRRARHELLKQRDVIFLVRSHVMSKLGRESLRVKDARTRMVVSRSVTETMTSLKIPMSRQSIINDACIEACFIDTAYDEAGQELQYGPTARPL